MTVLEQIILTPTAPTYTEIRRVAEYITSFVEKHKRLRGSNIIDCAEFIALWIKKYDGYFHYLIDMQHEREEAIRHEDWVKYQSPNPDNAEEERLAKEEADEAHANFIMAAVTFVDMLLGDIPWSANELGKVP